LVPLFNPIINQIDMKNLFLKTIILAFICLSSSFAQAGEIVLTGTYQGKNVFVKNESEKTDSTNAVYCTKEVFLNGVSIMKDIATADFEIDLSSLKSGAKVTIKIIHTDGCVPAILNPQVIREGKKK